MADRTPSTKGTARRWAALGFWLLLMWSFMFVVAPALKRIPAVATLTSFVRESGIPAGAYYYTDVEEVNQAEQVMRDTFRYYLDEREGER